MIPGEFDAPTCSCTVALDPTIPLPAPFAVTLLTTGRRVTDVACVELAGADGICGYCRIHHQETAA